MSKEILRRSKGLRFSSNEGARILIIVPAHIALELESEYQRLHNELLDMKKRGLKPKRLRLTQMMVKRVALWVGLNNLKGMPFPDFEKTLRSLSF